MEEKKENVKMGRPKKNQAANRVKHTTAINEDLLKWVKHYAIEENVTPADVFESALHYFRAHIALPMDIKN